MKKLTALIYRESGGLHEAAFILGAFAVTSQVLALLRDRLFAHKLGAGLELDIYYSAFRVPDLLFVSVASFVAITVIMPILIEKQKENQIQASRFIDQIFTVFFVAMIVLSTILYYYMPAIISMIYKGFTDPVQLQVVMMSRILLLSPILLGISNIYASITQSVRRFLVYALSPVLYNIGIIIGLLFFYPTWGIAGLAYGVILGAFLHILIQVPVAFKEKSIPWFTYLIDFKNVFHVLILAIPRTIGLSLTQLTILALTSLATMFTVGSIAIFQFAFNLQSVPLSIIGVSYSVAAFPALTRLWSENKKQEYIEKISQTIRHVTYWSMFLLVLFVVLRIEIVSVILGSGSFGLSDVQITAKVLAIFVASVYAQGLVLLFVRAYYAAGITRKPVIINIFSSLIILIIAFSVDRGVGGLALAFSTGMIFNAVVLFICFVKDFDLEMSMFTRSFLQIGTSSVILAFCTHGTLFLVGTIVGGVTPLSALARGSLSAFVGLGISISYLYIVKNREQYEILFYLKKKLGRS